MAVHTVSTSEELATALEAARGGDRIELEAGDYGLVQITSETFSSEVTITSADPDDMATIGKLKVWSSSNLTFENVNLTFTATEDTLDFESLARFDYGENITFRNCVFEGDTAKAGIDPDSPASELAENGIDGYPIGGALAFLNVDNIAIEDCDFSTFKGGLAFVYGDNIEVTGNSFENMRTTQLIGADVDNLEIRDNHFSEINPWTSPSGGGDHGDYIHIWTTSNQVGPSSDITIADNFFEGAGPAVQGIYIEDNNKGKGYEDVVIENNLMQASHAQGIYVERADGLIIRDNTLLEGATEGGNAPGVLLNQGNTNVVVENNVLSRVIGEDVDNAAAQNVVVGDNLYVQYDTPDEPGYAPDLFLNPLIDNGEVSDYLVLPGSAAVGVGARMTQYQPADGPIAGISAESRDGFDMMRVDVSLKTIYDPASDIDLDDAEVVWDFGDGTTASGETATHSYLVPGYYEISARVETVRDGTLSLTKTIEVETPHVIDVDLEGGLQDTTFVANDVFAEGDVRLESTELGTSAHLASDSAKIRVHDTDDMFDNTEMSIGIAFNGDASDGTLIYFSANVYASFQDGDLKVSGLTDAGESFTMMSDGANLNDGEWHQMVYTFDQAAGEARLYIDGAEVDQANGIEGAQKPGIGQDFYVGNPFGGSFEGHIDNLDFVRAALTPEQVEDGYQSFQAALDSTLTVDPTVEHGTAAVDDDNDQVSSKELQTLQEHLGEKLLFAERPTESEAEDSASDDGGTDGLLTPLLEKIFSLLSGLVGHDARDLQAQLFQPEVASGQAGVSDSGDEDDLHTLIPATGYADESGDEDEDDGLLILTH